MHIHLLYYNNVRENHAVYTAAHNSEEISHSTTRIIIAHRWMDVLVLDKQPRHNNLRNCLPIEILLDLRRRWYRGVNAVIGSVNRKAYSTFSRVCRKLEI